MSSFKIILLSNYNITVTEIVCVVYCFAEIYFLS